MTGYFKRTRGGEIAIALDDVEVAILRNLAGQLLELLGPGEEPAADPLDAALHAALREGPAEPPEDPVLARLFPDAYNDTEDASDASAEFRRFTEHDLRERKRGDVLAVLSSLDDLNSLEDPGPGGDRGAELRLDREAARRWLGALNDLRLALATRMDLTDEDTERDLLALPDSDPRQPMVVPYFWLTDLQHTLVESIMD